MNTTAKPKPITGWRYLPGGERLRAQVNAQLHECLPSMFGFHLLALGPFADGLSLDASRVQRRWRLHERHADIRGHSEHLPLQSETVDVVILPLTLDYCEDPHAVLREVQRVLIGDGRIVLIGCNPWSWWGLRALVARVRKQPWPGRLLPLSRVRDWLHLLGFDIDDEYLLGYRPAPAGGSGLPWWRRWLSLRLGFEHWAGGAVYMVSAQKRVLPLTPQRLHQRQRLSLALAGAPSALPQRQGVNRQGDT